jgi:hypothetical protein
MSPSSQWQYEGFRDPAPLGYPGAILVLANDMGEPFQEHYQWWMRLVGADQAAQTLCILVTYRLGECHFKMRT